MRIAINEAIRTRGISGTARVVDHLEAALIADPEFEVSLRRSRHRRRANRLVNVVQMAYWDHWAAGRSGGRPDLLISPCNSGVAPKGVPHLLWLLDTMPLDHPEWFDPGFARYARLSFSLSVRYATRVATLSTHSATRIRHWWPAAPPVEVIHMPVTVKARRARSVSDGGWHVLMVAATECHKNHAAAIDAVRIARAATGEDIRLSLIGPAGRAERDIELLCRHIPSGNTWLTRRRDIDQTELDEAYAKAWLVLQPSFDEGLGLPVLEAAGYAVPSVHSGRGALPEVAQRGNAGSIHGVDLADVIVRMSDPDEYAEASATALRTARCWSEHEFAQRLGQTVREMAAR